MQTKSQHIIDPKTIQDVKSFEWIAKKLANGFLHGKHNASRLGVGMEFQQYRPYVSGDDIRAIDWKMYAKTDKFFIKQTSIDTEHKFVFVIDNSMSMKYEEEGWSKLMYAKLLSAAMMNILSNQGDHFSWQSGEQMMPMGSGKRHLQYCIETLYLLDIGDNSFGDPVHHRSSTIILIADFYQPISKIQDYVRSIKHPRTELILFHLIGVAEKNLNFRPNTTFVDLESKESIDVNSEKIRKTYQQKLGAHISKVKNISFEYGAMYEEVLLNGDIVESLRRFFHHYQYSAF